MRSIIRKKIKGRIIFIMFFVLFPTTSVGENHPLAEKRFVDSNGFFTIVPPAGWRIQEFPQESRGKVAFFSSTKNVELRVLAAAVDFNSIEELVSGAKSIESRIGMSTNIEMVSFYGRPAINRSFKFQGTQLLVYDFLLGNIHHNIQFSARPPDFHKFDSLVKSSMETYEALPRSTTNDEIIKQTLAGKRRLVELMIKAGNFKLAKEFLKEGLEVDASDSELQRLSLEIDGLSKSGD